MPKLKRPRKGSLQFYPRKRAAKFIHSTNWKTLSETKEQGLLGFITYKAGMSTALVKDTTPKVQTANKQIAIPVTILEAPPMKIFSIRFYNNNIPLKDVVVSNDKELKKIVRVPKTLKPLDSQIPQSYSNITVLAYSIPKTTSIKKVPDMTEIAISAPNKLEYAKSLIGKEILPQDVLKFKIADVRGVTKGKGTQGPVKRFGLTLKNHKSEKGVRRPGSLGPWHPARVTFRTPMMGQMGLFSRIIYNLHILSQGKIADKDVNPKSGFPNYGRINTSYVVIKGSVQGPPKRQVLLTPAFRPSKEQSKKKLEFLEVIN